MGLVLGQNFGGNRMPRPAFGGKSVEPGIACNKDMDSLLHNRMLTAWSKITTG
jgi:hypothetical protein